MPSTRVFWVLLHVLAHLNDLVYQVCLLERGTSLDKWDQDFFDKLRAVGPLVVIAWVILIHTMTESYFLLENIGHED